MLKKMIFILSSLATAVTLFFFFVYVNRTVTFNDFTKARSKISNAAALASGIEESLENLTAGENTAIIKMPSLNDEGTIITASSDYCVMIRSNNILMFSIVPSPGTGRKHKTLYYRDFPVSAFNTSGNMLEFTCTIRGKVFQHFSAFIPGLLPVPQKGEDIFK